MREDTTLKETLRQCGQEVAAKSVALMADQEKKKEEKLVDQLGRGRSMIR